MNKAVLISGITGFIGSHIGALLQKQGYRIIGIKRALSDTFRCQHYFDHVTWINSDDVNWQDKAIKLNPQVIIHAAWEGVNANARHNLAEQLKNLTLLVNLLEIAGKIETEQFISLGSQAEYGRIDQVISENHKLQANTSYGIAKIAAANIVEQYCTAHEIPWYWLRVFSVFGENESEQWLIPSTIKKLVLKEKEILFTACDQKYAYMYIEDLARFIEAILSHIPPTGIYNISAKNAVSLKEIIQKIKIYSANTDTELKFGALPTRTDQSMHVEGDMTKFFNKVYALEYSDLENKLQNTVAYYKKYFLQRSQ